MEIYEQLYNSLDKPIPLKNDLKMYPVLVKDYYTFYSCLPVLTMDKNTKVELDPTGRETKVSNIIGLGMSNLDWLIYCMEEKSEKGIQITSQAMTLFELVFHVPKGLYCEKCDKIIPFEEVLQKADEKFEVIKDDFYNNKLQGKIELLGEEEKSLIENKLRQQALIEATKCEECGEYMRDVFTIKDNNGNKTLVIKNVEIGPTEFDEMRAAIPRQNILDYDSDIYIDPDLKEELALKSKMKNQDYTSPTLEKQLVCVSIGTGFTFEYLNQVTMRKLSLMLRLIDRKNTYYAELQASMSGMVKFPEGSIKHWIFTEDRRNIKDELTDLDTFKNKFDKVT